MMKMIMKILYAMKLTLLIFWASSAADSRQELKINGTFTIGAIVSKHAMGDTYSDCGPIIEIYVVMQEAFTFGIDYANEHILREWGVTLGLWVLDSCDNPKLGFQRGIAFVDGDTNGGLCHSGQLKEFNGAKVQFITGITGSSVAASVSNLAQYFCIPMIQAYSTSSELDNEKDYPYFLRTVPSDWHQAKATLDILLHFNWTYVAIVYEDSKYGQGLLQSFREHAQNAWKNSSRIVIEDVFAYSDFEPMQKSFLNWLNYRKSKVLIVYMDYSRSREMLTYLNNTNEYKEKFFYVGADGLGSNNYIANDLQNMIENMITTEPVAYEAPEFEVYLSNLTISTMGDKHAWLRELTADIHKCCLNNTKNCTFSLCNGTERYSINEQAVRRSHYMIEAILLIANTIKELYERNCSFYIDSDIPSNALKYVDGQELFRVLQNATIHSPVANFNGFVARDANYPSKRNGPGIYSVFQLQLNSTNPIGFQWEPLGTYDAAIDQMQSYLNWNKFKMPKSVIFSSIKKSVEECLPSCTNIDEYPPLDIKYNQCFKCNKICRPFTAVHIQKPIMAIMILLNGTGSVGMILALYLFVLNANTPMLVRSHFMFQASLAVALAFSFMASFATALISPSEFSYKVVPIFWTTMLTLSLSIIFVKSARFTTIFRFGGPDKLPVESRPLRLATACFLPLLFHGLVVIEWTQLHSARVGCLMLFTVATLLAVFALFTSFKMGSTMFQFRRNEASWIFVCCLLMFLMFAIPVSMRLTATGVDQQAIMEFVIATLAPVLLSFNVIPLCWNLTANRMDNNFMFVDKKIWQPIARKSSMCDIIREIWQKIFSEVLKFKHAKPLEKISHVRRRRNSGPYEELNDEIKSVFTLKHYRNGSKISVATVTSESGERYIPPSSNSSID